MGTVSGLCERVVSTWAFLALFHVNVFLVLISSAFFTSAAIFWSSRVVYEYKTGPYFGQTLDKVFIRDHRS